MLLTNLNDAHPAAEFVDLCLAIHVRVVFAAYKPLTEVAAGTRYLAVNKLFYLALKAFGCWPVEDVVASVGHVPGLAAPML